MLTNYSVATGEWVEEFMEDHGLDIEAVAASAGLPVGDLRSILDGLQPLAAETAEAIATATTLDPGFLMRVEALYQCDLERLFTDPCRQAGTHGGHRYRVESTIHWCPGAAGTD